ncbi:YceK/YidQ family lipoprotein [Glaesserella sp.]|uniref:YceK/YidQ family lipoprotein n=1 Tax=Glaesserella sp. TaxID=2094731 RepID=UPI00359F54FA
MKQTACKLGFLLFVLLNLSGCGTILSLMENDYTAYAGVSKDFHAIQDGGFFSVLAVVDLPLSFVLDTLMLPVTLSQ